MKNLWTRSRITQRLRIASPWRARNDRYLRTVHFKQESSLSHAQCFLISAVIFLITFSSVYADLVVQYDIQPRAIRVGEVANCSITIRGVDNPPTPTPPQIQGFQITSAGTERNMSFGSGGRDSFTTFHYRLLPLQTGTFTVPSFTYAAAGQAVTLPAIKLQVVAPDATPDHADGSQKWSEVLLARLSTTTTNIYNQQVFDLELSIYSKGLNFGPQISLMNMPASGLGGLDFQEVRAGREVINNQAYDVRRFHARATALTAGTFTLEPTLRLALRIPRKRQQQRDPFFGDAFDNFFGRYETQPVDVKAKPLKIVVHPLPERGKPKHFNGAVGRFQFTAKIKPAEIAEGDPVTLTMQIAGEGNIENISPPKLNVGDKFKVYDAKMISKDIDSARAIGRKLYEQVIIPRSSDIHMIPELKFSYFDPASANYYTIKQGPFPLKITPASNHVAKVVGGSRDQSVSRTQLLGTDIIYLKPAPPHWKHITTRAWYRTPVFMSIQIIPPIALAILFMAVRRKNVLSEDIARARRYKAPRAARGAIQNAENAITKNDRAAFFEALFDAISSYFGHRLNLAPGEVTSDIVHRAMQKAGLENTVLSQIDALFERCEVERFGATNTESESSDKNEMRDLLTTLHNVLKACEKAKG